MWPAFPTSDAGRSVGRGWRLAGLPRGLEAEQVTALLASCDLERAVGVRDFVILALLVRLGMRRGEVPPR